MNAILEILNMFGIIRLVPKEVKPPPPPPEGKLICPFCKTIMTKEWANKDGVQVGAWTCSCRPK